MAKKRAPSPQKPPSRPRPRRGKPPRAVEKGEPENVKIGPLDPPPPEDGGTAPAGGGSMGA